MKKLTVCLIAGTATSVSSVLVQAEPQQLPTIIVEGSSLRPGDLSVAPDSTGLKDTASLLQRIPGANVNRNGPLTGIANYRGMAGNRVNVKVDGFSWKAVGPNSMDPGLSHIPAPLTESLQVNRGIAPVSSGMDTIGGSMSVKSKRGEFTEGGIESHGVGSIGYSEVDSGSYGSIFTSLANENHKVFVNGSREYGNNYRFNGDDAVVPSEYDRNAFTVGYGYKRDEHEFEFRYDNNDTGLTGTPSLPLDIESVRGGVASFEYAGNFSGLGVDFGYHYQNMRHAMNNTSLRETPVVRVPKLGEVTVARRALTEVDGFAANIGFSLDIADGELKFGADVDQSHHDATIFDPNNAKFEVQAFNGVKRDRYSGFVEWSGKIVEKLNVELGARYTAVRSDTDDVTVKNPLFVALNAAGISGPMQNGRALIGAFNRADHEVNDGNIDLAAVFNYSVTDDFDIEVGLARKTRAPSYQELYVALPLETTGGLADGRNYIGNLDLNHEVSYQAELGFEWRASLDNAWGGGSLYLAPRAFYHHVEDYIQGVEIADPANPANAISRLPPFGGRNALQFNNIDAYFYGADLEMGYAISDAVRVDATVNYVRARRRDIKDNLYRIAPFNGRMQVSYDHHLFNVSAEGVFYAGQNDVSSFNDELTTAGYALLNLRGEVTPYDGFLFGFGVENVLDKEHANHLSGLNRARGNPDLAVGKRVPARGRNVYATLSYHW